MSDNDKARGTQVFEMAQEFAALLRKQLKATGDERLVRFAATIGKDLYFLSSVNPVAGENLQLAPSASQSLAITQ